MAESCVMAEGCESGFTLSYAAGLDARGNSSGSSASCDCVRLCGWLFCLLLTYLRLCLSCTRLGEPESGGAGVRSFSL